MVGRLEDAITLGCLTCMSVIFREYVSLLLYKFTMGLIDSLSECSNSSLCECTEEVTEFDTDTHAKHIKDVFALYSVNFKEWCLCQTANHCNLNSSIVSKLEIPHVGCTSYKLNLEIKNLVKSDLALKNYIDSVNKTMTDCKTKIRKRAMLQILLLLRLYQRTILDGPGST